MHDNKFVPNGRICSIENIQIGKMKFNDGVALIYLAMWPDALGDG